MQVRMHARLLLTTSCVAVIEAQPGYWWQLGNNQQTVVNIEECGRAGCHVKGGASCIIVLTKFLQSLR